MAQGSGFIRQPSQYKIRFRFIHETINTLKGSGRRLAICFSGRIPFFFAQLFNGVAKHGSGHSGNVSVQEPDEHQFGSFAGFADPACHGFVNQVMVVIHEEFGNLEGVADIALPDEMVGADNGCSAAPTHFLTSQVLYNLPGFVKQPPTTYGAFLSLSVGSSNSKACWCFKSICLFH